MRFGPRSLNRKPQAPPNFHSSGPHAVEDDDEPDEGAESEAPTVDALVEDQEEASR